MIDCRKLTLLGLGGWGQRPFGIFPKKHPIGGRTTSLKGKYAFYPIKLFRFAEKMKLGKNTPTNWVRDLFDG